MSAIQRILNHYDDALSGEPWHGDAIWQVLDGISAHQAAARPIPDFHTIWEIVMHMTFWEGVATQRLAGRRAGLVEELNFPAMPALTEENWRRTLDEFRASNRAFREAFARLDPAKLDELTAAGKRTFYGEAHGILEHHIYHIGQIAMLKKITA
ncbi:MAG TPA: DinB family protein [Terriglobales bacterium]|nr:DinB family protein [Terriglobales bacterium]